LGYLLSPQDVLHCGTIAGGVSKLRFELLSLVS